MWILMRVRRRLSLQLLSPCRSGDASILMQDTAVAADATLKYIIADKDVSVSDHELLAGSEKLPLVVPKGSKI